MPGHARECLGFGEYAAAVFDVSVYMKQCECTVGAGGAAFTSNGGMWGLPEEALHARAHSLCISVALP